MTSDSFLGWLPHFINYMFDTVGFWRMFLTVFLLAWLFSSARGLLFYSTSTSKAETKTYSPGKKEDKA